MRLAVWFLLRQNFSPAVKLKLDNKLSASKIQWCDADPGLRGPCVVAAMNKFTWTTEVLWRKGMAWPLSE